MSQRQPIFLSAIPHCNSGLYVCARVGHSDLHIKHDLCCLQHLPPACFHFPLPILIPMPSLTASHVCGFAERGTLKPPPSNAANVASSYFPQTASGPDSPAIPFLYFRFVCVQTEGPSGPSHQMQLMLPAMSSPTPTPKPASMSQYQP